MATNAPNPLLIAATPLQCYFVDKDTGKPLSGGIVTFYKDESRTIKKPVYQLSISPSNEFVYTELPNPLILSSIGTFSDDNGNDIIPFYYPYEGAPTDNTQGAPELYYITVYAAQPPVGSGVFQFDRVAWPPNIMTSASGASYISTQNEIVNPQFIDVSFLPLSGYSYSVADVGSDPMVSKIAPGWDLVTHGTGTVILSQVPLAVKTTSNPPYALRVRSSGSVTSLQIRQRIQGSPRLLDAQFASGYFLAASQDAIEHNIVMTYESSAISGPGFAAVIAQGSTQINNQLTPFSGNTAINSNSIDTAPEGYVDIVLTIPVNSDILITSLQMVAVKNTGETTNFIEQSTPEQLSALYYYYDQPLKNKATPNFLTGWDFPLNPAQLGNTIVAHATLSSFYTWDQTITYQSVANTIFTSRGTMGELAIQCQNNASQAAIIQYIPKREAQILLKNRMSINVEARSIGANNIPATVSLFFTATTLPNLASGNSIVAMLNSSGFPTSKNGTWTEITRAGNLGRATFNVKTASTTTTNTYSFSGFDPSLASALDTAEYMAIVLGFGQLPLNASIAINSVNLVAGDIPCRPAAQSYAEVLRDCEYYLEKSFDPADIPGTTITTRSAVFKPTPPAYNGGSTPQTFIQIFTAFDIEFKEPKRIHPNITFWSVNSGTSGVINIAGANRDVPFFPSNILPPFINGTTYSSSDLNLLSTSVKRVVYFPSKFVILPAATITGLLFHYVADSRLGLVF